MSISQQLDIKAGALAVAQAKLPEDQALLDVLNGGPIPADATGAGIVQLQQARIAVQLAQANLNLLDDEIKQDDRDFPGEWRGDDPQCRTRQRGKRRRRPAHHRPHG